MIAFLEGKVISRQGKKIVILVQGVGYLVEMSESASQGIQVEDPIALYIHTQVREDDISLFGFLHADELRFFRLLIQVSGIGPKLAMGILESPMGQVQSAIIQGDSVFLERLPGLGKKTAGRMILELKGKLETISPLPSPHRDIKHDALSALLHLGYQEHYIQRVLQEAPLEIQETEALIRYFLQRA